MTFRGDALYKLMIDIDTDMKQAVIERSETQITTTTWRISHDPTAFAPLLRIFYDWTEVYYETV